MKKQKKVLEKYMVILQSFFGKKLEKTFRLKGKESGPTVVVSAGVHGDEHCGLKAFAKILPKLQIASGEVIFVIGNPHACFKGIRATKKDLNLNRLSLPENTFSDEQKASYENVRTRLYKKLLAEADALLDIHSGTALKEAVIICEPSANSITRYFPKCFTREIYGFDAIEPGAWDGYMLSLGKPGITIECGFHQDPEGPMYAQKAIWNFLKVHRMIPPRHYRIRSAADRKYVQMFQMYRTVSNTFTLARDFVSLEPLKKGEIIGHDGEVAVVAPSECLIVFPHNCTETNAEAFLLGREIV